MPSARVAARTGFFAALVRPAGFAEAALLAARAGGFLATVRAFFRAAGLEAAGFRRAFAALRRAPFPAFFLAVLFLATVDSSLPPDHTIGSLSKGGSPRIVFQVSPAGISIEIRPLVRTRAARWRLGLLAAAVLAAALAGGSRLARVWEGSLRRGAFEELPLVALLPMTLAVGVSTPLALAGLAALAFAEERIDVTADEVSIRTTAFERTRVQTIPRRDLVAWVETYRPLPPWWTWAFRRLAARVGTRLVPLAGAAGHGEKRVIGLRLARATGLDLLGVSGRPVPGEPPAKIPR